LQAAETRIKCPISIAVTVGLAITGSFVTTGTDHAFHIGLHQQLRYGLGHAAQKIAISGFGQQLGQRKSILGHRVLLVWG
jgi:hypothetical protein